MGFLKIHHPLLPSPNTAEKAAFAEALAGAERAIMSRRRAVAIEKERTEWLQRMPNLEADALRVIDERGGDPIDNDLGED
ncbi:MAG: hypothetical protein RLZZ360_604 [Candidatus Parcubacteria bacterium]|jgi:hypothetical protein